MRLVAEEVRLRKDYIAGEEKKLAGINAAVTALYSVQMKSENPDIYKEALSILIERANSIAKSIDWERAEVKEVETVGYSFLYSNHVGCSDPYCMEAIKKNPATWNYFITTGHAGCKNGNLKWDGYKTSSQARKVYQKALKRLTSTVDTLSK